MRTKTLAACGLIAAFATLLPSVPAAVLPIAVFDFESKDENVHDLGPKVAALVTASLSAADGIVTVERAELARILGEQELGLSGTIAPETAAKVGRLTGARVLVTGRVFIAAQELNLVVKVIGSETSRVYGEVVSGPANGSLAELARQLAARIAADVTQKADTLAPPAAAPADHVNRINRALGPRKRPIVSIRIAERHFGNPVADPAAQTELALILEQCGFRLVDGSAALADVEVSGEAFSAFGAQKGNLVSCKARIELQARKRTGDVVATDRQTSVAADLTEQTAAKTALQLAVSELADRIVPKLAE